ncbi:MAG TPA: sorbosone dehydrogenase family protein, partial [Allosphingosinicella sp.]|nr:sorbosone dehydrogenase family protein [Allosphingosinicella sp.]
MKRLVLIPALAALATGCGGSGSDPMQYGGDPQLPGQQHALVPSMKIANPTPWDNRRPTVPEGYTITAIATGFGIARQTLVLPNGDILVAEGRGGGEPALRPKDIIAGFIKAKGTSDAKSGNRLTLLRDADGDGVYEGRSVFADHLNAPYGLALVGNQLYVANP